MYVANATAATHSAPQVLAYIVIRRILMCVGLSDPL